MQRTIDGLCVTIIRKSIKNMHLRVLSPNGEIQITAPNRLSVSQIDRFVREKRGWIEARQQQLAERPAATNPAFADGQTVYLWGGSYTLRLEEAPCSADRKSFYLSTRRMTHRSGNRF